MYGQSNNERGIPMRGLDFFVLFLMILGGLNWGLYGLFDFNLIDYIFGRVWIDRVIYVAIGLGAVYMLIVWKQMFARIVKK